MEISLRGISGTTTKAACEAMRLKRRACKGIYDFLLHTFVACEKAIYTRK